MLRIVLLCAMLPLAGCATLGLGKRERPPPESIAMRPEARPATTAAVPPAGARTADALDTTTEAEKAAALAAPAPAGERSLGQVAVSLGNPAEAGFWLRGGIVTVAGKGRVATAGGASVAVDLIPGAGAATMSLAAYRALGLSLTDLPQVTVYAE